ncbi:hypothetical protein CONPUDRAFT_169098 [Coniophora puteana RWD-64-598 SS2]|uniref:Uncharacterized protein n=1 Tax=Coniophora puteana (strain RWD-64-598) TaxID=741705 RepID=A0A5M3MA70_CONPW|nr:uncharacterized protein CONPUDRAFT_169098 [Coniophora puteana RWD-64-598 SS2]EIW75846.1 hypothetical protein CONPUDRAFT_169098 [Coniophora puteana RWD-64-598 SS2]
MPSSPRAVGLRRSGAGRSSPRANTLLLGQLQKSGLILAEGLATYYSCDVASNFCFYLTCGVSPPTVLHPQRRKSRFIIPIPTHREAQEKKECAVRVKFDTTALDDDADIYCCYVCDQPCLNPELVATSGSALRGTSRRRRVGRAGEILVFSDMFMPTSCLVSLYDKATTPFH